MINFLKLFLPIYRRMANFLRQLFRYPLALVFPRFCLVCHEPLLDRSASDGASGTFNFCEQCQNKLVTQKESLCPFCAAPMQADVLVREKCPHCSQQHFHFTRIVSLGVYEEELRHLILQMKKDRQGILARSLAKLLLKTRGDQLREINANLIVPVPMHFIRKSIRGVNSSERLASILAEELQIPWNSKFIRRQKMTKPLWLLTPYERQKMIAGAFDFSLVTRWSLLSKRSLIGKRILLVDDILTTGTTTNELSRLLLQAGAESVFVAVLARSVHLTIIRNQRFG